jgi:outer membrane protein OmpA-like peptidoglycan-associated protein
MKKKRFLSFLFDSGKQFLLFKALFINFIICGEIYAQDYDLITITGIVSGIETNNALYKANSATIRSLRYIRAQRIKGPQNGSFTIKGDNIRYTAKSNVSGIPGNMSRIRFTFLQSDRKTLIPPSNFRFIINDIDGPNNEALATNCDANLRFLGTANPTNLNVINLPPTILAIGEIEENDGPTSRVMFEFVNVSVVELDNYANDGYLKDFDMNDDYPISKPVYVKCKSYTGSIYTPKTDDNFNISTDFITKKEVLMLNIPPIYFDNDESYIRTDAIEVLKKALKILKKYPKLFIELRAHTDSRADDEYNLKLSDRRAKSTVNWLVANGIKHNRIKGVGFGETKLINKCTNNVECSDEEHQLNRRTEFVILNPEVLRKEKL